MTHYAALALVIGLALFATAGDYFLKRASLDEGGPLNSYLLAGCVVYVLGAFGWIPVLRTLKLAVIGSVYSVATVLFLAVLGAVAFNESLTKMEIAGIMLGVSSIFLLSRTGA